MYKNDYFVFWYLTCWKFRFLQSFSDFQNLFNLFENIFPLAGNPENRRWGSFGYIGLLTMLGCSIHTSLKFLGIAWVFCQNMGGKIWKQQRSNSIHTSLKFLGIAWIFWQLFIEIIIRIHSKIMLPKFLPCYITYQVLTFLTLNGHWHFISTYLPLLVNVILEWLLICIMYMIM